MSVTTNKMLAEAFRLVADDIESGRCAVSQEQSDRILNELRDSVNIPISKAEACAYLNMSRSTFDAKVAAGELPKGRKRQGFKELYWIKRELR